MRELGILFKPDMHLAIRHELKTETRRIEKMPSWADPDTVEEENSCNGGLMAICTATGCFSAIKPRYQVGDHLWVKEAWAADRCYDHLRTSDIPVGVPIRYLLENPSEHLFNRYKGKPSWYKKRSPLFMPKWPARTWLEVTGVRAERLREITEEGAVAEGCYRSGTEWVAPGVMMTSVCGVKAMNWPCHATARDAFKTLWGSVNGDRSWWENPWVWVYEFKLLEAR